MISVGPVSVNGLLHRASHQKMKNNTMMPSPRQKSRRKAPAMVFRSERSSSGNAEVRVFITSTVRLSYPFLRYRKDVCLPSGGGDIMIFLVRRKVVKRACRKNVRYSFRPGRNGGRRHPADGRSGGQAFFLVATYCTSRGRAMPPAQVTAASSNVPSIAGGRAGMVPSCHGHTVRRDPAMKPMSTALVWKG